MNMLRTTCRRIAPFVLGTFGLVSLYTPMAQAGMISTPDYVEQTAGTGGADVQRQQVQTFLQRDDVRERLSTLGVDPAAAQARVDGLTDQEVAAISQRLDTLPAGGDSFIGALVFIFVVLLLTDILGFTNVFPFVKKTAR
ncbi:MAG: PA2779 family protein [Thiohalobacteraceae bacterium]